MIIENMYRTKIELFADNGYSIPSYNIDIDNTIYIKVTLTDFNGLPIIGEHVSIYYDNNTLISTGVTDNDGVVNSSFVCVDWGIHSISVMDEFIEFKVGGYRLVKSTTHFKLYEYEDKVGLDVNFAYQIVFKSNWDLYDISAIPWKFRPESFISAILYNSSSNLTIVGVRSNTSSSRVEILIRGFNSYNFSNFSSDGRAYLEWRKVV